MIDPLATTISVFALAVSSLTAWLTFFRKGAVRMTRPTVIFFGSECPRHSGEERLPKVYLRTLLFATAKRGLVVESMHITLIRNETRQNFNIWVYGNEKLARGSGLFVSETGITAEHHFFPPENDAGFEFREGTYTLNVYAQLLGNNASTLLASESLEINRGNANALQEPGAGLYFDWGPGSSCYIPHIKKRPPVPSVEELVELAVPKLHQSRIKV